ncbi:5b protein [Duck coronavirus DK/GD/27/2014]|uniref:5b protein n=1 Tax=Duck coronavirus DK/GD/27/2014 TaxID=2849730 RepID=A0A0F6WGI5_9GAMC|nr:5b protein [Duck coronavirus]AKF17731.1 5b protein [Duck coronavirus DK/GD/27/2014]
MNNSKDNPFSTATARKARVFIRGGLNSVFFLNEKGQPEVCPFCTALVARGQLSQEHLFNNNILSWQAVKQLESQTPPRQSSN